MCADWEVVIYRNVTVLFSQQAGLCVSDTAFDAGVSNKVTTVFFQWICV